MTLTIWHNPNCTKSRATLALLQERGLDPDIRLYKDNAPTVDEIRRVLTLLNISAADLIRTNDPQFTDLGLDKSSSENTLIAAMAKHPALIERPVVITDTQAAIGRPPENVLTIL
ncbi:MAG: arsenate reductase (glutaredoxin) [Paracoccaceae bacterium]